MTTRHVIEFVNEVVPKIVTSQISVQCTQKLIEIFALKEKTQKENSKDIFVISRLNYKKFINKGT